MNDDPLERAYYKKVKDVNPNYHFRFIPKKLGKVHADTIIFGNKVVLVSFKKDIFATMIESKEIADAFRIFYELAWQSAKKPKK